MNFNQVMRQRRVTIGDELIVVEERFYNADDDIFTEWTEILRTPNGEIAFGLLKID